MGSDYLQFWGKATTQEGEAVSWHPVAFHCLDVAACVERMLRVRAHSRQLAVELFCVRDIEEVLPMLVALAALHDIGKFAGTFQRLRPELWPQVLGQIDRFNSRSRHTDDGFLLWRERLIDSLGGRLWSNDPTAWSPVVQAALAHHGTPAAPDSAGLPLKARFGRGGITSAEQYANDVLALLISGPLPAHGLTSARIARASWWVSGLITTADWVASNTASFPYCRPPDCASLAEYWESARKLAVSATRRSGLEPPPSAGVLSFSDLTGVASPPTPMQRWAETVQLTEHPTLFVIEDATGSGKTEAAQVLVNRLIAAEYCSGAYWAMPTQATANAMYDRQARVIGRLFRSLGPTRPSLILAHGQARMNEQFVSTVLDPQPQVQDDNLIADEDLPGALACSAFIASDRRRALLADLGAGTVDQAVLAALPSKFNTVRLFGLAGKVLVLDEVHGYDTYVTEEICALLRFHRALGGHAVALSATLPAAMLRRLINAWSGARDDVLQDSIKSDRSFPLALTVGGQGAVVCCSVDAATNAHRAVRMALTSDEDRVYAALVAAVHAGARVVWIRNTVGGCIAAAKTLRASLGDAVSVFHARFAQSDRQAREAAVQRLFGKDRADGSGQVLIATQVVEQSLDLDFDFMVSDLAPIDLLIQRMGRLHRHHRRARPADYSSPTMWVYTPDFVVDPGSAWLEKVLPGTRWVYRELGVLWRSLRALQRNSEILVPSMVRSLVSEVYDSDECPQGLQRAVAKAEGESSAAGSVARQYVLLPERGYVRGPYWSADVNVPTRLGEGSHPVRLGRVIGGAIEPWAGQNTGGHGDRWSLSEVRVRERIVPLEAVPVDAWVAACAAVRGKWGKWERGIPIVPMEWVDDGWVGCVQHEGSIYEVRYSEMFGLEGGDAVRSAAS